MSEELQLRNLSEGTSDTYLRAVARFARHFGKSPEQLGAEDVRRYLLYLLEDKHDTWSTIQVNRGALKFLYLRSSSNAGSTTRSLLPNDSPYCPPS
jgi:hypothetical protein